MKAVQNTTNQPLDVHGQYHQIPVKGNKIDIVPHIRQAVINAQISTHFCNKIR